MKRLLLSLLTVCMLAAGLFAQDGKNLPVLKGNTLTYNGQSVELSGKMATITLIGWSLPSSDIIIEEGTTEAQVKNCRQMLKDAGYPEKDFRLMTEQQFAEEAAKEAAARAAENAGDEANAEELEKAVSAPVEGSIYDSVEEQPIFKGGEDIAHWVANHLKYPVKAREDGISGRVTVRFVVTDKGMVRQVKVMRGVEESLDKEAVRVIAATSGKWFPGVKDGKRVNTRLVMPIVFQL
ncbi:MAG: energy transducer TonB [Bacteroidales bacterium]|nr:energy transducer TonB [Bacteroidales bacterium]MBR4525282.1 energy transducer TonB [Bacteroidales bacterium]